MPSREPRLTGNTSGGQSGNDTGDQGSRSQTDDVDHSVGSQCGQNTDRDTSGSKVTETTESVRSDELSTSADPGRVGLGLAGERIKSNEF